MPTRGTRFTVEYFSRGIRSVSWRTLENWLHFFSEQLRARRQNGVHLARYYSVVRRCAGLHMWICESVKMGVRGWCTSSENTRLIYVRGKA